MASADLAVKTPIFAAAAMLNAREDGSIRQTKVADIVAALGRRSCWAKGKAAAKEEEKSAEKEERYSP